MSLCECVECMPNERESGVLYVSEEFGIALHLCACGCGSKIKTLLGLVDASEDEQDQPQALRGPAGKLPVSRSNHSWRIVWAEKVDTEQIADGSRMKHSVGEAYRRT